MARPAGRFFGATAPRKSGFTLIEVVLVLVVLIIVSSVTLPYFGKTYRGTKLRTASRLIERMSRYARNMAIMREETLTMVIDESKMQVSIGSERQPTTDTADGQLDQSVLKRLGYVENDGTGQGGPDLDIEVSKLLPDDLTVQDFQKDTADDEVQYENLYLVHFYPNGQCDWFKLDLEDNKGMSVELENDPISGKIWSEFEQ